MADTPKPPFTSNANYLRAGRWALCAHCRIAFVGEHYCGAPWQNPTIGGDIDDLPQAFAEAASELSQLSSENARLSEALKAANLAHEQIADACTAFGADVSKKDSLDVVLIRCTALMLRIGQALIVSRASLPPESQ